MPRPLTTQRLATLAKAFAGGLRTLEREVKSLEKIKPTFPPETCLPQLREAAFAIVKAMPLVSGDDAIPERLFRARLRVERGKYVVLPAVDWTDPVNVLLNLTTNDDCAGRELARCAGLKDEKDRRGHWLGFWRASTNPKTGETKRYWVPGQVEHLRAGANELLNAWLNNEPPDGPEPPCMLRWNSRRLPVPSPIWFGILEYLWPDKIALVDDVVDHAWGERAAGKSSAVKSALNKLNDWLVRNKLPFRVTSTNSQMSLSRVSS